MLRAVNMLWIDLHVFQRGLQRVGGCAPASIVAWRAASAEVRASSPATLAISPALPILPDRFERLTMLVADLAASSANRLNRSASPRPLSSHRNPGSTII